VADRRRWRGALDTRGRERTMVVGGERGEAVSGGAWSGCGQLSGRTRAVLTAPLRHGAGAWQPCGDSTLIGGPGAERGRLTGRSHVLVIFELKFTPG
jgi:hypothetical protein